MERTKKQELYAICDRINRVMAKLSKPADYVIHYAYGQPRLERESDHGGVDVSPRLSPRNLAVWMYAFLDGIDAATK